jgi:lipopolysaccharide/colanic/teichoic acid biosynthesis glycosyltransferase
LRLRQGKKQDRVRLSPQSRRKRTEAISQILYRAFIPPWLSLVCRYLFLASIPVIRQIPAAGGLTWQTVGICERIASVALFAALSPLVAGSALVVTIASRRSPFIAHRRVGWRGETLWMIKLRTMWGDGPRRSARWVERISEEPGAEDKDPDDPRVPNWFARFCRRHSIDEIPQLWHVIRGQMSLVGPRPATAAELRRYYSADAEEMLQVRPGLAGLWQISGRNRLTYSQRKRLDLQYVRERSLSMYFKILLRTIPEVLAGKNSW